MTHRFPLKEIARQAGLGVATVERAINNRAHVSPQAKARVEAALAELEAQEEQLSARGRRMFFDVVVDAPDRFSREVQRAAEHVAPQMGGAVCRPRFFLQQDMSDDDLVRCLARIGKRGSHGVCLKAQDRPRVREAVEALIALGIPVVTLATDILAEGRSAYIGLDNGSAGRTAAYLISMGLGASGGTVLTTRSREQFLGEGDREIAFVQTLAQLCPNVKIHPVVGGAGLAFETSKLVRRALAQIDGLRGIYSMGGGNHTIMDELRVRGMTPDVFVAHDLDADNRGLIEVGHLNYVLHHDLRVDMTKVFKMFLYHHKLVTQSPAMLLSRVQVITPENVPPLELGD